jgi:hypothetical protein
MEGYVILNRDLNLNVGIHLRYIIYHTPIPWIKLWPTSTIIHCHRTPSPTFPKAAQFTLSLCSTYPIPRVNCAKRPLFIWQVMFPKLLCLHELWLFPGIHNLLRYM